MVQCGWLIEMLNVDGSAVASWVLRLQIQRVIGFVFPAGKDSGRVFIGLAPAQPCLLASLQHAEIGVFQSRVQSSSVVAVRL